MFVTTLEQPAEPQKNNNNNNEQQKFYNELHSFTIAPCTLSRSRPLFVFLILPYTAYIQRERKWMCLYVDIMKTEASAQVRYATGTERNFVMMEMHTT